ncbi:LOW QUALITY PROTEIN: hypothetical protein YC2023_016865 [Brassica napus]
MGYQVLYAFLQSISTEPGTYMSNFNSVTSGLAFIRDKITLLPPSHLTHVSFPYFLGSFTRVSIRHPRDAEAHNSFLGFRLLAIAILT